MEKEPQRAPSPLGVLRLDGFQVRHCGPGRGRKKTLKNRVEWHEQKIGVYYRHEQSAPGVLAEKVVVSGQGPPLELSQRPPWEARRHGLNRARDLLALGDGADWIWQAVADRWPASTRSSKPAPWIMGMNSGQPINGAGVIMRPLEMPPAFIGKQIKQLTISPQQP